MSPHTNTVSPALFNMIEQQIRPWGVLAPEVLAAFHAVPREQFVQTIYQGLAYADMELPIGEGQTMLSPKIEGRILQALALQANENVLLIGCGSGYLAALLAKLARQVLALEIYSTLAIKAKQRWQTTGIHNVQCIVADGSQGYADAAPFDAIVCSAALPLVPWQLTEQLKPNGRLFVVVGQLPVMNALLIRRSENGMLHQQSLFETVLPFLQQVPHVSHFQF